MADKANNLNVLYIIGNGFRPEEYFYSKDVVEKAGFKVITAGKQKKVPARIISGMPASAEADITFDKFDEEYLNKLDENFISVVVPGGSPGWENLIKDEKVLEILRKAKEKNMLVASICASPAVLAKAGILKGKKATVYPGMGDYIKAGGGVPVQSNESFENKQVIVKEENLITGNGPWASRAFGEAIVEELNKKFKNRAGKF